MNIPRAEIPINILASFSTSIAKTVSNEMARMFAVLVGTLLVIARAFVGYIIHRWFVITRALVSAFEISTHEHKS